MYNNNKTGIKTILFYLSTVIKISFIIHISLIIVHAVILTYIYSKYFTCINLHNLYHIVIYSNKLCISILKLVNNYKFKKLCKI